MPVRVFEITAVATPEHLLWLFHQGRSGGEGLIDHLDNFGLGRDIVGQREGFKPLGFLVALVVTPAALPRPTRTPRWALAMQPIAENSSQARVAPRAK